LGTEEIAGSSGVSAANFSKDGDEFLVAFENDVVRSIETNRKDHDYTSDWRLAGHINSIAFVARERDEQRFVTVGKESIRLWNEWPSYSWVSQLGLETPTEKFQAVRDAWGDEERPIFPGMQLEIVNESKDKFLNTIESLLAAPDYGRIARALSNVPRCLEPERRKKLNLSPDPPLWCFQLKKWPYDSSD
jgi:hypothetical protein